MLSDEAVIYLAAKRNCIQNDKFRSYITIPNPDAEQPSHSIIKFLDNTLSAKNSQQILADNFVLIVLLPLVGAIEIKQGDITKIVNSGEIAYILTKSNEQFSVSNPYENELVNYLEIWMKQDKYFEKEIIIEQFELDKNRNSLVDISSNNCLIKILIGKYDGRKEGELTIEESAFIFVVSGVLECQNRLLEQRSALSIWNTNKLEFEGLGRENVILIVLERIHS